MLAVGYLLLRYYDEKRKNKNYLKEEYTDHINAAIINCLDSIYDYEIWISSTKEAEGRCLGKIKGFLDLQISMEKEEQEVYRYHITFLPKKYEFNLFNPTTWNWKNNLKVALIDPKELPDGLNGNLKWVTAGIDYQKWFVYSISDKSVDKQKVIKNIQTNIYANAVLDAYEKFGKIVNNAVDSESGLLKDIKRKSEYDVSRR